MNFPTKIARHLASLSTYTVSERFSKSFHGHWCHEVCPLSPGQDFNVLLLIGWDAKQFSFPELHQSGSWKWGTETKCSQFCLNLCLSSFPIVTGNCQAQVFACSWSGAISFAVTSTRLQDVKMANVVSIRWVVAEYKHYFWKAGVWVTDVAKTGFIPMSPYC